MAAGQLHVIEVRQIERVICEFDRSAGCDARVIEPFQCLDELAFERRALALAHDRRALGTLAVGLIATRRGYWRTRDAGTVVGRMCPLRCLRLLAVLWSRPASIR